MRELWLWPFAQHLHTPPPMWGDLTVDDTDRGVAHLMTMLSVDPATP